MVITPMTNTTDTTSPQMPLGISGFTHADLHEPAALASLYDRFCERLGAAKGVFGACMGVALVNDGPVTLLLES